MGQAFEWFILLQQVHSTIANMSVDHTILIFLALLAEGRNSHGGSEVIGTGLSYSIGTYLFVSMFNKMLQKCTKIDLSAIFEVSFYIAPFMDLPERSLPTLKCCTPCGLRCDFSSRASTYSIENRHYAAILFYQKAVL